MNGEGNADMTILTRRSVLRSSLGLTAAGTLMRPYIANAAATTATVWWQQGFAEEEDVAFKQILADYQKASGNAIDYSLVPYAPLRQKIVSAVTSGVVPDLFQNSLAEIIALYAWDDKLVDVSDVVETQREEYTDTALLTVRCYNNIEKKRSFYGVPYAAFTACPIRSMCSPTIYGGRWSRRLAARWRTSRRLGMPITISSRRCRRNCAPRACAASTASVFR
jgi:ABC-type glycerol-3-phosphate transport system substrate-binding protein